jgi:hypothetical protein
MAHRRVKEIDYDSDEYDEYYSGEEEEGYGYDGVEDGAAAANNDDDQLSAEDKEHMRVGTESVRKALGDAFPSVTDAAIQEALWHYYYDVAKSVTYLKNKSAPSQPAQPKKQKQISKFDQAVTSAAQKPVEIKGKSFIFSSILLSFLGFHSLPLPLLAQRHHTCTLHKTLDGPGLGRTLLNRARSDRPCRRADQSNTSTAHEPTRRLQRPSLVQCPF